MLIKLLNGWFEGGLCTFNSLIHSRFLLWSFCLGSFWDVKSIPNILTGPGTTFLEHPTGAAHVMFGGHGLLEFKCFTTGEWRVKVWLFWLANQHTLCLSLCLAQRSFHLYLFDWVIGSNLNLSCALRVFYLLADRYFSIFLGWSHIFHEFNEHFGV